MINIITSISKYVFLLLGALFILDAFWGHINYSRKRKAGIIRKGTLQKFTVIIFSVLGNIILYLNKQDFIFIVFLFMELFYLFFIINIFPMIYTKCNRILINDMAFLMSTGFLVLARLSPDKLIRQYLLIIAGTLVMFIVPVIIEKIHFLTKLKVLYIVVGIGLLGFVLVMGNTVYGANLSINIKGVSVQPSEFVKLTYVMFIASMLYKNQSMKRIIVTTVFVAAHVLILVASNDLGASLIFYVTYVVMLYDATHRKRYLLAGGTAAIIASIGAYALVAHVKVRVNVWLDPFKYIDNKGFQIAQSIYAILYGDWFGTGLTKGLPGSIPVVTKDFIFPAISEEFGGLFAIIVMLVVLSFFYEVITVMSESGDKFNRLLLGGFGILYIFQCFLNIGGVIKCIPCTGVTLPFVSYGGSSVISSMIMIAIIQGIAAKNDTMTCKEDDKYENNIGVRSARMLFGGFMLFVILAGYFIYLLTGYDKSVLDSSYNKRITKMESNVVRGNIYSADGALLAESIYQNGVYTRNYPYADMFAHVIGSVWKDGTGLEATMKYRLLTSNDNLDNRLLAELKGEKTIGDNIQTTLDTKLQDAAFKALGDYKGSVVVMGIDGSILAMVSKPDYDPNYPSETLETDEGSPFLDRSINALYPPGSTFKPFTLLEYYRECVESGHIDDFMNFSYDCTGAFELDGYSIKCVGGLPHGTVDTYEAIAHSCNGALISMGLKLNLAKFKDTMESFGFNKQITMYDNLGAAPAISQFRLDESSDEWMVMQTSFGQGQTLVTPFENALIMQSIANNGIMKKPFIIDKIFSASQKTVYSYIKSDTKKTYGSVMTETEAKVLSEHLKGVITEGFPHVFGDAPYTCAGKSGTAQYGTDGYEHSLFVGFMPYESPKIIVSVVLESFNENSEPDRYAVNVVKDIFDAYYEEYVKQ